MHKVRKPPGLREEKPRDIIIKFHLYDNKAKIWSKLRGLPPLQFERTELQVFADLSAGTLARRHQLKPLLEQMRMANIKYSWGFPTSLIVQREGRTMRLKFLDDLQKS